MLNAVKDEAVMEKISAIFDGEQSAEGAFGQLEQPAAARRMRNWALIGAALRDELPAKVDLNFSDKVMAKIQAEDQAEVKPVPVMKRKLFNFKVWRLVLMQTAAAAAVAVVTVVGWQTYNAADVSSVSPAAGVALGPIGGVNLASYQAQGQDKVIKVNPEREVLKEPQDKANQAQQLQQKQKQELERINHYVRSYMLDTASSR